MKRLLLLSTAFVTLAACSGTSITARYQLQMDVTDADKVEQLTQQTLNVMERRLEGMEVTMRDSDSETTASGTIIVSVSADNQDALTQLGELMSAPFDFAILSEVQEGETADITLEQFGGFVRTGITGEDLSWIESGKAPDSDLGRVHLQFTTEGRTKMEALFQKMKGENIGIFVRDQLVSLLQVETGILLDDIYIEQIPSFELAEAFADDVNVGIHVTVTPLP